MTELEDHSRHLELKYTAFSIIGDDFGGFLARITDCARRCRVDIAHCNADVFLGRANIYFVCEGSDHQLDRMVQTIQSLFPGPKEVVLPGAFPGYSVDIHDVPNEVDSEWDDSKYLLVIESEDAIGLLASVTEFLGREGVNLSSYRGVQYFAGDRGTVRKSRHTFEVRPPKRAFSLRAFELKLAAFKEDQNYARCDLEDPMRDRTRFVETEESSEKTRDSRKR